MVKFGLNIPNFGSYSNISNLINLAINAEKAGWDGIFLWTNQ